MSSSHRALPAEFLAAALDRVASPHALAAVARLSDYYASCTFASASYGAIAGEHAPPALVAVDSLWMQPRGDARVHRADEAGGLRSVRWRVAMLKGTANIEGAFASAMRNGHYTTARWLYRRYGATALSRADGDPQMHPAAVGDVEMLAWFADVVGAVANHAVVAAACAGGHLAAAHWLQQRHALAPLGSPGTLGQPVHRSQLVRILCGRTLDSDAHVAALAWFCTTYLPDDGNNVGGELLFAELAERRFFFSMRALMSLRIIASPKCAAAAALAAIAASCVTTLSVATTLLDSERDAALVADCMLRAAASGWALRRLVDAFCARDMSHPTHYLAPRAVAPRATRSVAPESRARPRPTLPELLVAAACRAASADAVGVLLSCFHVPLATIADGTRIACAYAARDVYALLAPRCGPCVCGDKDCLGASASASASASGNDIDL